MFHEEKAACTKSQRMKLCSIDVSHSLQSEDEDLLDKTEIQTLQRNKVSNPKRCIH
jgi:hypothetical protein